MTDPTTPQAHPAPEPWQSFPPPAEPWFASTPTPAPVQEFAQPPVPPQPQPQPQPQLIYPTFQPAPAPKPPRKWLGRGGGWIVFLGLTFFWLFNVLYNQITLHHTGLSPNSLVLGGFGMTAGLAYTLAYRLRPAEGISVIRLSLAFILGGLVSTELAIMIESPLVSALETNPHGILIAHSLAGVIEELCKIALVIVMARGLTNRSPRNGLFLGGAVGLGFAAFEDMRYAWSTSNSLPLPGHTQLGSLFEVTFGRDAIGPFEHPVMTALFAAAVFAATRNGRFRITPTLILVYLGIAAAHGLIDSAGDLFAFVLPRGTAALLGGAVGIVIALGLSTVWLIYSRRLKRRMLADELELRANSEAPAAVPLVE